MKKIFGSLTLACILMASMSAFAQDSMKQDSMKQDDTKQDTMKKDDSMKKDDMKKDKKAKKMAKQGPDEERRHEERRYEEGRQHEERRDEAELVSRPECRRGPSVRASLFSLSRQQLAGRCLTTLESRSMFAIRPSRRVSRKSICSPAGHVQERRTWFGRFNDNYRATGKINRFNFGAQNALADSTT